MSAVSAAAAAVTLAPGRAHHLTMSKLALAHICAYGFRPEVPQTPSHPGKPAQIGTVVHALAEAHVKGRSHASNASPDILVEALKFYNDALKGYLNKRSWTACEIGLEYDAESDTSRPCARRGDAGYDLVGPMRIRGTLDLVAIEKDHGIVEDLKSGKLVTDKEQLYGQAVAVARHYGLKTVDIGYLYARKTKVIEPEYERLDADAIDYQAGRLSRLLRKLPTAEPVRGDHCWRCNARPACPAWSE